MQLRLPRPKDSAPRKKRPSIVSTADAPPCGICQKQVSRYTCPKCNLSYCSLACFRAPEHRACADSFDRTTLADDLKGDSDISNADKDQMMEMLKKFEDQQRELEEIQAQENGEGADDEEEEDASPEALQQRQERAELEKRLADVDLDSLPPEQILSLLTPAQQQAFTEALQDPARVNKLVEDEFEGEEPWWAIEQERKAFEQFRDANREAMRSEAADNTDNGTTPAESEEPDVEWEDVRPAMLNAAQLPPLKVGPDGKAIANPQILHNIVAVLFAYSFTLRTFSFTSFDSIPIRSPERITIVQELAQLLPFLVQRSTASFVGLEDAIEYVAAREEPQGMSSPLIGLLLHDVASLLRPNAISAITPADSSPLAAHALANVIAALSDVHALFAAAIAPPSEPSSTTSKGSTTVSKPLISRPSTTSPLSKQERQQCALASAKLLFYASFVNSTGKEVVDACGALAAIAEREAARRVKEEEERMEAVERRKEQLARGREESPAHSGTEGLPSKQSARREELHPLDDEPPQPPSNSSSTSGPKIVELE